MAMEYVAHAGYFTLYREQAGDDYVYAVFVETENGPHPATPWSRDRNRSMDRLRKEHERHFTWKPKAMKQVVSSVAYVEPPSLTDLVDWYVGVPDDDDDDYDDGP